MAKIVRNPAILGGKPIIDGTRISVELVLDWLEAGWSIEKFTEEYPHLTREDIVACIAYARERVAEESMLPAAE